MPLLSCGNCDGSLSNTKLILKLLGWLLRPSSWELCIYLSARDGVSSSGCEACWCHVPSTGAVRVSGSTFYPAHMLITGAPSVTHVKYLAYVPLKWKVKVKVTQSCPTLCNPMDYTVHGILQARIVGSLSLLPEIFPTQESNRDLLHCMRILYQLNYESEHVWNICLP